MPDKKPNDGKNRVAASITVAMRQLARRKKIADPPPHFPRGADKIAPAAFKGQPPNWKPNDLGLPGDDGCECPVVPLGREGGVFHMIDSTGIFRSLTARDFSHSGIQDLFSATPNYPEWAWPRHGKVKKGADDEPLPPRIESFEDDAVRKALFFACAQMGQFSAENKVRGRGAWQLKGGGMLYHAGEEIWRCEVRDGVPIFRCEETGMVEDHLYPRAPELPAPWDQPMRAADNPAGALLKILRCWHWEKPEVDPVLLLGWIGAGYLSGALDWRPALMLLGDYGTGKSSLHDALKSLFGDALFKSGNASAAGIRQNMRNDARPIALDEMEDEAENARRIREIIQMMRVSSSGDTAYRGGADHKGVEFQLNSAFLMAAINNPIQSPQDVSRVAILRLRPLPPAQAMPDPIDADTCGRKVLARMMAQWHRFPELFAEYSRALAAGGHSKRGFQTYGTLLACADMMLGDELAAELGVPLTADAGFWSEHLAAASRPETADNASNWRGCGMHLLTAQVPFWRSGARTTVGKLVLDLLKGEVNSVEFNINHARNELALTGLGILVPGELHPRVPKDAGYILAVPNTSSLVNKLFEGSHWSGAVGVGGPWKDALRQAPETVVITDRDYSRVTIGGVRQRCSLVVLNRFSEEAEK
jgi:hypothetical protein